MRRMGSTRLDRVERSGRKTSRDMTKEEEEVEEKELTAAAAEKEEGEEGSTSGTVTPERGHTGFQGWNQRFFVLKIIWDQSMIIAL